MEESPKYCGSIVSRLDEMCNNDATLLGLSTMESSWKHLLTVDNSDANNLIDEKQQ